MVLLSVAIVIRVFSSACFAFISNAISLSFGISEWVFGFLFQLFCILFFHSFLRLFCVLIELIAWCGGYLMWGLICLVKHANSSKGPFWNAEKTHITNLACLFDSPLLALCVVCTHDKPQAKSERITGYVWIFHHLFIYIFIHCTHSFFHSTERTALIHGNFSSAGQQYQHAIRSLFNTAAVAAGDIGCLSLPSSYMAF